MITIVTVNNQAKEAGLGEGGVLLMWRLLAADCLLRPRRFPPRTPEPRSCTRVQAVALRVLRKGAGSLHCLSPSQAKGPACGGDLHVRVVRESWMFRDGRRSAES